MIPQNKLVEKGILKKYSFFVHNLLTEMENETF